MAKKEKHVIEVKYLRACSLFPFFISSRPRSKKVFERKTFSPDFAKLFNVERAKSICPWSSAKAAN
jgi:hypothetical protein